jgi:glycerophosphoryl diester phosphodiesterase
MKRILPLLLGLMSFILPSLEAKKIEVQGHRGARSLRSENTLPSFMTAIEAGADVLELDVLVSLDDELIIHHDFFINKELCTYLDGKPLLCAPLIRTLTLSEIKQFDSGQKRDPKFPKQLLIRGTQIPTLQELFNSIHTSSHPNAKKVRLNLEIKRDPRFPEFTILPNEFAKKLVDRVKESGFSARVYYSSFDPTVLLEVRKLDPNARIGFIFDSESLIEVRRLHPEFDASSSTLKNGHFDNIKSLEMEFLIEIASSLRAEVLSPDHTLLNDAQEILAWKKRGFQVIPWTVNDPKRWEELIEMGIDGMITDYPQELIQFLKNNTPTHS